MDGVALDQGIQRCMIGVRLCELIALLLYDSTVNITLTAFFVVSITQGHSAKRLPSILKLLQRRKASTKPQAHRYTLSLPTGYNASDMSLQPICTRFSDRRSDVEGSLANDLDQESTASEFELDDIQTSSLFCLAFRSFIVCLVGVTTSVVNLSVLMAHNGQETGTTFLRWCLIDVVINAVVISAVMQGRKEWWSDDDHDAVHPPA
ncbi:hypothetical protein FRC17_002257 [Serendipita sp. 399]|nr:hypothetical protein FRC17_002257 [Serendipita sp. 399]